MKIIESIKYKSSGLSQGILILFSILFLSFASCIDDIVITEDSSKDKEQTEEDFIAFTIKLDKETDTRASDFSGIPSNNLTKYDNYIDTQDKFRVFFFTEAGDFLFGATDRIVGSLSNTSDHNSEYWYVRIPMTKIVDRENQEYDIDKIKTYLKNHPFRVAVLANWPNAGAKINPSDWDDSEGTQGPNDNPSSTLKGEPLWNWSNSILNQKASDIKNINDLHHVYKDVAYSETKVPSGGMSKLNCYDEFMAYQEDGYYMGEPTDWVKMRDIDEGWQNKYDKSTVVPYFDSKETANQWIRINCTPEVTINKEKNIYRHYQHMWFLWNFDASYKYGEWVGSNSGAEDETKKNKAKKFYGDNWGWNDNSPATVTNPWGVEWYGRNGYILYDWMKTSYNNGGTPKAIGEKTIDIGEKDNDVFFKYITISNKYAYCVKVGDNYGIQLPAIGEGKKSTYEGMIMFQARTSGTLRVKWGSADGNSAGLAVQKNTTYKLHGGYSSKTPTNWINPDDGYDYYDISVGEDSQPMYIFCTSGKAVVYSIEFIRGKYLYDTDREGIMPDEEHPIPMYGVQWYDKISDWQRGTTINLDKDISLIRALAKVEVFIKQSFGTLRHVYMRSLNRGARCEPIDVHTSTDSIWNDNHSNDNTKLCEWFRVQEYGASYAKPTTDKYPNWLSWFYGSWKYNSNDKSPTIWKTEGQTGKALYEWDYDLGYYVPKGNKTGWNVSSLDYSEFTTSLEPPRIYNPYINRSDFCRFIYVDDQTVDGETYHHYVLYLPEKNIDDPTTVGKMDSTPKVPHIEYRFYPPKTENSAASVASTFTNTEYNLDDNDCYRIYFTNYGFAGNNSENVNSLTKRNDELYNKKWSSSTYDDYEKNNERLSYHWPIMRNHLYKFYVGGESPENPDIHVRVSDWSHRKVVVEW